MKENHISPDDPRITAYALNELDAPEVSVIEAAIRANPLLQARVDSTRALARQLEAALADEPMLPEDTASSPAPTASARLAPKVVRFPYYLVGTLAAACFAVIIGLTARNHSSTTNRPLKNRYEITFTETNSPTPAATQKAADSIAAADAASAPEVVESSPAVSRTAPAPVAGAPAKPAALVEARSSAPSSLVEKSSMTSGYLSVLGNPLSTFPLTFDPTTYSTLRRFLDSGQLPPRDYVRVGDLVNAFPYRYKQPEGTASPIAATMEVASAPWNPSHRLVRIGLRTADVSGPARPPMDLVVLVDCSTSPGAPSQLPAIRTALHALTGKLRADDRIALVSFADRTRVELPPTSIAQVEKISEAIDRLSIRGEFAGDCGLELAAGLTERENGTLPTSRMVLCSSNAQALPPATAAEAVRTRAQAGTAFSVLDFAPVSRPDLRSLAEAGQGEYTHVDPATLEDARMRDGLLASLWSPARDVRLQVEFNPALASSYRLIGYEKSGSPRAQAGNETPPADDLRSGHEVTALYEVVPTTTDSLPPDGLKYQQVKPAFAAAKAALDRASQELLTVKIRYHGTQDDQQVEYPLVDHGTAFAHASKDFKFAAAVASFGMLLSDSPKPEAAKLDEVLAWAKESQDQEKDKSREEFIDLVQKAKVIATE